MDTLAQYIKQPPPQINNNTLQSHSVVALRDGG